MNVMKNNETSLKLVTYDTSEKQTEVIRMTKPLRKTTAVKRSAEMKAV